MKKLFVCIMMLHTCSLTANFRIAQAWLRQALSLPSIKVASVMVGYPTGIVVAGGLYAEHVGRKQRAAEGKPRLQPKPQPEVGTPIPSER